MDLRVLKETRYGGERHSAGSVLRDVPITTGRRLLLGGFVEHHTPEESAPELSLDSLTVAQLRQLATDRGLEVPGNAKKADLIALLQDDPAGDQE